MNKHDDRALDLDSHNREFRFASKHHIFSSDVLWARSAIKMDVHGAGVVAVLGTVGAATGAISAVIVYTICARRRRLPLLTTGPLNWHVSSFVILLMRFDWTYISVIAQITYCRLLTAKTTIRFTHQNMSNAIMFHTGLKGTCWTELKKQRGRRRMF